MTVHYPEGNLAKESVLLPDGNLALCLHRLPKAQGFQYYEVPDQKYPIPGVCLPDSRGVLTRFVDETRIEGNGITLSNPCHRQCFIEAKEVKPLLKLAAEALFSKTAVSA